MANKKNPAPEPERSESGKHDPEEIINGITWAEEIALDKAFGVDPWDLMKAGKEVRLLRTLQFILLKRDGLNDFQAKAKAMQTKVSDLLEIFETSEEESEEEAFEVDESGKEDESQVPENSRQSDSE